MDILCILVAHAPMSLCMHRLIETLDAGQRDSTIISCYGPYIDLTVKDWCSEKQLVLTYELVIPDIITLKNDCFLRVVYFAGACVSSVNLIWTLYMITSQKGTEILLHTLDTYTIIKLYLEPLYL